MSEGKLQTDKLFKGLTRPTMILGVSFTFFLLNALITIVSFVATTKLWIFLISFGIHGVGYILCYDEPLILDLLVKKMQKCSFCKNKMFYGGNSYNLD